MKWAVGQGICISFECSCCMFVCSCWLLFGKQKNVLSNTVTIKTELSNMQIDRNTGILVLQRSSVHIYENSRIIRMKLS